MGKKSGKRNAALGSIPESSPKRFKPPHQPAISIKYEDMPPNHKRKFFIDDDCGTLSRYIEIVSWLRTMGCFDGFVFEEIPNLNWSGEGYPLVEVEVVSPENKSAKFIFIRSTLYIIAFLVRDGQYQLSTPEFVIEGFFALQGSTGAYTFELWKFVGPKSLIAALNVLDSSNIRGSEQSLTVIAACEIFYVHLSEAARLYPVEWLVCSTLTPMDGVIRYTTYQDDESLILGAGRDRTIREQDDILSIVKATGSVNHDSSLELPSFIQLLLKKFSHFSKIWYAYALTGREVFEMRPADVSKYHIRSRKSLRRSLAVLCNVNLDKVLNEKRFRNLKVVSAGVYQEMIRQVRDLQEKKKVKLPETSKAEAACS